MSKTPDFLILGAGIFGLTSAIELSRRGHSVAVMSPDEIPHPLAASTDISKAVRMEYGTDEEYMDMAIDSMEGWREWNEVFERPLYHETGFLVLTTDPLEHDFESFAGGSYINLLKRGYHPDRLSAQLVAAMFPAFNSEVYRDGFYNPVGGYVESGRVITELSRYAKSIGIDIRQGVRADEVIRNASQVGSVRSLDGETYTAGHYIVCAGNHTPFLLPELHDAMEVTGHPIFHLRPELPAPYMPPDFTVFAADIQHTGWYGFPYHPIAQVVKVANHGVGIPIHPDRDPREVTAAQEHQMRTFLQVSIPQLAQAPVVATKLCCYTDTRDGHFWIDRHPELSNLTVAGGGSGHAFKMGPVLGEMIADVAEGGEHKWSDRYGWRVFTEETEQQEEARYKNS